MTGKVIQGFEESIKRYMHEIRKNRKKFQNSSNKVYLGRSFAQLDFQYFLAKGLFEKSHFKKILVDTGLSFKGSGKQPIYPDIVLVKGNRKISKIHAIVEVKIDLGFLKLKEHGIIYNNNKKTYKYNPKKNRFKFRYNRLFKSKYAFYWKKDYQEDYDYDVKLKVPRHIKKVCIIITKRQDHSRLDSFIESMNDSDFEVLVVLEEFHPRVDVSFKQIKRELISRKKEIIQFFKVNKLI